MTGTQKPRYLHRRAIVPAETLRLGEIAGDGTALPDLDNVQGDVYFMFPKRWQRFTFFKISNVAQFQKDLDTYRPKITNSSQTVKDLNEIHEKGGADLDIVSSGIAFTKAGLKTMGIEHQLGDPHFDQGSLYNEKKELGDQRQYDSVFDGDGNNHGVILLTAGKQDTCKAKMDEIQAIFKGSISVVTTYEGRVRPGDGEHFGWRDGISQPALKGIAHSKPGQRIVNSGVTIMGYPGDPVHDNNNAIARPEFTKDGSFMVFRKLEQNVLFLEDYVNKNWLSIPAEPTKDVTLTEEQRKKLFAARMVGRFKSGVPLALSPYIEDTAYLDPEKINNFDYTEPQGRCPFSAHVRKTAPRNLQPVVGKEYLDASMIVRAGIPYGDEISSQEREEWKTYTDDQKENAVCPRGLLFVCYQSSIDNGFYRQTTGFANNDFFPLTGLVPQKTGQDPILGGPKPVTGTSGTTDIFQEGEVTLDLINNHNEKYEVAGIAKKVVESATSFEQKFFVTSRGGDYYFVPSISTVKSWGAAAQSK
ncbi:Dyp-type peroxidase [Dendrothele bispora CBS 962.96]|uniref:Dyp-type peroxidase n=1 Tax=Dendrothele bispora (strain CBS 962.96) TaxID=1314807 RepID=A0A4S8LR66_DENBC|nr:Dyp-type peroxidase [Dendrothele bispora CBS 962.96]